MPPVTFFTNLITSDTPPSSDTRPRHTDSKMKLHDEISRSTRGCTTPPLPPRRQDTTWGTPPTSTYVAHTPSKPLTNPRPQQCDLCEKKMRLTQTGRQQPSLRLELTKNITGRVQHTVVHCRKRFRARLADSGRRVPLYSASAFRGVTLVLAAPGPPKMLSRLSSLLAICTSDTWLPLSPGYCA